MRFKSIRGLRNLNGKIVVLRLDLNAPLVDGRMDPSDRYKLKASLPTIAYLLRQKAAVVIVSHLGEPRGFNHDLTLRPVVALLARLLGRPIKFWPGDLESCQRQAKELRPGEIAALENIRFHHEEYANDPDFGRQLARLGDIFVNDAFGAVHRRQASMVAITRYITSYAGFLMEHEVTHLHKLLSTARRPLVAVMGGNKISTKILLIKKLLRQVDWLLLGGALANTVLASMDYQVGKSAIEDDMVSWSRGLMDNRLKLPVDARVASSLKAKARLTAIGRVGRNDIIYDLGPDTVELYGRVLRQARTVIWNGPLGYFEDRRYAQSTRALVSLLGRTRAKVYVGGGETVKAVLDQGLEKKLTFVSTGGGAMLTLLEGRPLPALQPLLKK